MSATNPLPSSPSRAQALVAFEPILHKKFKEATQETDPAITDVMHYVLFSVKDRFCASAAWMIAPRLGIDTERLETPLCSTEILRCALAFNARPEKFVEPAAAEAAAHGLVPLAFDLLLNGQGPLSLVERASIAANLAHHSRSLSLFKATGSMLELLVKKEFGRNESLPLWFGKLGLFTLQIEEFIKNQQTTSPDWMNDIKNLETELLDLAREMNLGSAAHEIIEPLADLLKCRLQ